MLIFDFEYVYFLFFYYEERLNFIGLIVKKSLLYLFEKEETTKKHFLGYESSYLYTVLVFKP